MQIAEHCEVAADPENKPANSFYSVTSWVEQGLMSHQTHYRSYRSFYGSNDPTNSVKALKEGSVTKGIRLSQHRHCSRSV